MRDTGHTASSRVSAGSSTAHPRSAGHEPALREEDVQALRGRSVSALRVGKDVRRRRAQRRSRVTERRARRGACGPLRASCLVRHDRLQPRPDPLSARRDDGSPLVRSRERVDGPRRGRGGDRSHRLVRGLGGQARTGHRQLEPRGGAVLRLHDPRADRRRGDRRSGGAASARARLTVAPRTRRRQHRRDPRAGEASGRSGRAVGGVGDVGLPAGR